MGDDHFGGAVDDRFDPVADPIAQIGLRHHHVHHVDGPIERCVVRRLAERGDAVVAGEVRQRLDDTGTVGLEQAGVLGAWHPPEQVTVEADGDIGIGDLDTVMPQPVPHGGQPPGLQLVGTPQLVECSVNQHDPCHLRSFLVDVRSPLMSVSPLMSGFR